MPLRDHFRQPTTKYAVWEEVHGAWPASIAFRLNGILPPNYRCGLKVHLGAYFEVDIATFARENETDRPPVSQSGTGPAWQSVAPTILLETEELAPAEYEVRVYDDTQFNQLVAVVEIVSPSNKDRPLSRAAFVDKCHALLLQNISVAIVDPVTCLSANLFAELAARIGAKPPAIADCSIYAVSCRTRPGRKGVLVETWENELHVSAALPTLPLWLTETLAVDLELEATYEDTCRGLRIP